MQTRVSLAAIALAASLLSAPAFACTTVSTNIADCGTNVGIGDTSPSSRLSVNGAASAWVSGTTGGIPWSNQLSFYGDVYGAEIEGIDRISGGKSTLHLGNYGGPIVIGSVSSPNTTTINGNGTTINGGTTINNGGTVWGGANINGTANLNNGAAVTGNETVTGHATINGGLTASGGAQLDTLGLGVAPYASSTVPWSSGSTSDSARAVYGTSGSPSLSSSGAVAEFTNDTSYHMINSTGIPMWGTVNSIVRNTSSTAGPNNNIASFTAFGSNEGPSDDTGLSGSGTNEMVGYFANISCRATNAHCWGSNQVVLNAAGLSGGNLIGDEINLINNQDNSHGQALRIIGGSTKSGSYNGINILSFAKSGSTAQWQDGIYFTGGSAITAVDIGPAQASGVSVGSMPINFGWIDSSGNPQGLSLSVDGSGNLKINGVSAVSCSAPPSSSFQVSHGIVTRC